MALSPLHATISHKDEFWMIGLVILRCGAPCPLIVRRVGLVQSVRLYMLVLHLYNLNLSTLFEFVLYNFFFSLNMAATAKRPEIIELARGLNGIPWCEEYELMISGMMYVSLDICQDVACQQG